MGLRILVSYSNRLLFVLLDSILEEKWPGEQHRPTRAEQCLGEDKGSTKEKKKNKKTKPAMKQKS
jgi:hypothetical protein